MDVLRAFSAEKQYLSCPDSQFLTDCQEKENRAIYIRKP